MGLFDLPAPLLNWLHNILAPYLPDIVMLAIWAVTASGFGFIIFRRLTTNAGHRAAPATPTLVPVPLIAAFIPTIFIATWLGNNYEYAQPRPGEIVKMEIHSMLPETISGKKKLPRPRIDKYKKRWPNRDGRLVFRDTGSAVGTALPASPVHPLNAKKNWWNAFFGNPVGYIPPDFAIQQIKFHINRRKILTSKYYWLSNWRLWFLLPLAVSAFGLVYLSCEK